MTEASTDRMSVAIAGSRYRRLVGSNLLLLGIVALIIWFSATVPTFASISTVTDVLNQSAVLAVVVFPFALLMICGYVDLSVGSNMALSATCGAIVMAGTQSVLAGALVCAACGAIIGALNGLLIAYFNFSAIIVTLATLTAGRGLAQTIFNTNGQQIGAVPSAVTDLGVGTVLGIPNLAIAAAVVLAISGFLLRFSPSGRQFYAIGVNPRASYLSGINVRRTVGLLYIFVGAITGVAAFLYITRYVSVQPTTLGSGFEIEVLTAVLLGGVSFTGGKGTISGALLGVVLLGVLSTGLQQMAVLPATQLLLQGVALGLAAALQWWTSRLVAG